MKAAAARTSIMQKLDKSIFSTLFFSIFATVTGVGIVVPLLPVYARNLGASGLYIGMIFGAFSFSRTILLPYFGRLSDKRGRKPFIVPGMFAYTIISIAFLFSNDVNSIIVLRFAQGAASAMLLPVIQAYVGDITPGGREGFTMGLFNMSLFLGLSLGPVLGGIIRDSFDLNAAFISMGCLSFIGFLLSFLLLPPTRDEMVVRRGRPPTEWKRLVQDRDIAGLFFFRLAYTACIGIVWGFLPVLADTELSLSSSLIGILVMLGILVSGIIHVPMGYLADRINKKLMVVVGGLIVSYAMFSFKWAGDFWETVWASLFFGIGGGISIPALTAMAVIIGDKTNAMGSVMALITVAHSLGMLVGAMLAGVMMDLFQLRQIFPLGMVIMGLGVGAFIICTKHPKG
ncbi:MAG: MFS transporter [Deltaproteobacteria bacterium]|nr:MAG: MFS transporter [Deltaproteobacteria bacterium]